MQLEFQVLVFGGRDGGGGGDGEAVSSEGKLEGWKAVTVGHGFHFL